MRNVDEFSLVQVKQVEGRLSPSLDVESMVELATDDVDERDLT